MTTISANDVHRRAIIVDGHCDTPYRMRRHGVSIADPDPTAQLDLGTLQASGITASFFAAYVPPHYADRGAAKFAFEQIDLIQAEAEKHPGVLLLGTDAESIRRAKRENKVALMIGVEGGHAIEDSLDTLRALYDRGTRYMTLTHVNTNNWADSSGDEGRHGGLTEFGRTVVRTMNDLGMIVDISHVSDRCFEQALETSRVPIIASHSSCRALTRHPRNMTDAMLRDLAAAGGICMINFFSAFINDAIAQVLLGAGKRARQGPTDYEEIPDDRAHWKEFLDWFDSLGCPKSTIDDAIDHIVHAATVAGIDAVGIGSDFDGVPDLPVGLSDASMLPAITDHLIRRGFSAADVEKVLGGNFMRLFDAVEKGRTPL